MGKLSRRKGAAAERELAKDFSAHLGRKVKRNLGQYQESSGRDLDGTEPLCVQIKHTKKAASAAKVLAEAAAATDSHYWIPVAVQKQDRGKWILSMYAEDFFEWFDIRRLQNEFGKSD